MAERAASDFPKWLDRFDQNGPFRKFGQLEHHRQTIELRRAAGAASAALANAEYLRSLYDTLVAWGIGARASKLKPFAQFSEALRARATEIDLLDGIAIDAPSLDTGRIVDRLWRLISSLAIVDNEAPLVSGTKALHHLLPELVVPMDRAYTQVFFGWQNPRFQYGQAKCFAEALEAFRAMAIVVNPAQYVAAGWRSSRTKLIDNAVVAVVQDLRNQLKVNTAG